MTDVLASRSPQEVAAWYGRLADAVALRPINGQPPLSAQFMRAYLANRDPRATLTFAAPAYLPTYRRVTEQLRYHRRVFLSEEAARINGRSVIAGLRPRLADGRWDGVSRLTMEYESLVEIGPTWEIPIIQARNDPAEMDLFSSLRGFQMKSEVVVSGVRNGRTINVSFQMWTARARDRYDWDYSEHLTVPNPDFMSRRPGAIEPRSQQITVYHSNARRIEQAGLAAPYDLVVGPWRVTAADVTGPATLTI